MSLRPLQDRILVKRLEEETKTAGGIFIPETAKEKPQRGEIVAAGHGKKTEEGRCCRWMSRWATRCSSASMPVPKSRWTVKSS